MFLVVENKALWNYLVADTREEAEKEIIKIEKENPGKEFSILTMEEYREKERAKMLTPIEETTEKEYNNALDVLPPLAWRRFGELTLFCMSEFTWSTYTIQYGDYKGRYYSKMVNFCDKSTWITEEEIKKFQGDVNSI